LTKLISDWDVRSAQRVGHTAWSVRECFPNSSGPAQHRCANGGFVEQGLWSVATFELQSGEVETPAVQKFRETGNNDYRGNADAIADGKRLYASNCIICHGADGTGKMGPTLVGKDVVYKQVLTDPGMFSIMDDGASGAMQSFHRRGMKQDEILRIVAYVRTLEK
jgi:cytochrome c-L